MFKLIEDVKVYFSVKNQISTFGLPSLLAYTYIPKNKEKGN